MNYHLTKTPDHQPIILSHSIDYNTDIYSRLQTDEALVSYYQEKGYVICRHLIPFDLCEQLKITFQQTIKPSTAYFYRQVTAQPEQHQLNSEGYMLNALLNLQDLQHRYFGQFKHAGLAILTYPKLRQKIEQLLGHQGILVQSMFFEGNSATWPHQDTYYLDSSDLGKMVGIWVALEDISAEAGRFFVYPHSHQLEVLTHSGDCEIAFHHNTYKQKIIEIIQRSNLPCYAPFLQQGDVLFWNSRTIHGSLKTDNPRFSRCSLTGHYIPQSSQLLQYQKRIIPLKLEKVNDSLIHHPKNLDYWFYQVMFQLEIKFPHLFQGLKQRLIQVLLQKKGTILT